MHVATCKWLAQRAALERDVFEKILEGARMQGLFKAEQFALAELLEWAEGDAADGAKPGERGTVMHPNPCR